MWRNIWIVIYYHPYILVEKVCNVLWWWRSFVYMVVMIEKTEFCYKSWILRVAVHCKQNSYIKVCGWWSQNKKNDTWKTWICAKHVYAVLRLQFPEFPLHTYQLVWANMVTSLRSVSETVVSGDKGVIDTSSVLDYRTFCIFRLSKVHYQSINSKVHYQSINL